MNAVIYILFGLLVMFFVEFCRQLRRTSLQSDWSDRQMCVFWCSGILMGVVSLLYGIFQVGRFLWK